MKRRITALGAGVAALAAPAASRAQTVGGYLDLADRSGLKDLAWTGLVLILVLALLWLTLKAIRKLGRFKGDRGRAAVFELRGIHPLDNRKYLAAVAVEGRLLVIGVTPDRLTPLGQWPLKDENSGDSPQPAPGVGPDLGFRLPEEDAPPDISVVPEESPR